MSGNEMKVSGKGLAVIKHFEGLRLTAYLCPAGVLTIGYGHTGKDVLQGMKISVDRAIELLLADVAGFERSVAAMVSVPLTQGMFDALVSFAFNLGAGKLKGSTLLRRLNDGDKDLAADEFLKWDKANGKPLAGLTERRKDERELFLS
jgi:lysozyme